MRHGISCPPETRNLNMAEEIAEEKRPPYLAYTTFKNFIDGMRENGIPARIDRSVMPGQSGGNQKNIISALRFFGLIDPKAAPTSQLRELVESKDEKRKQALKPLVEEGFSFLFDGTLDLMTATEAQVHEKLQERSGFQGDTLRKCHSFFVLMAEEAGIPLGKHLKSRGARGGGPRRRSGRRKNGNEGGGGTPTDQTVNQVKSMPAMLLEKFPQFDPSWPDDIKTKWFAGFEQLMKSADVAEK